mgnify:CR=1 FL=1
MYVRPVDQGQTVEIAYGYDSSSGAYKRVTDRGKPPGSNDRVVWYYGDLDWDLEPEGEDQGREPCVVDWVRCAPPREED